MLLLMMLMLPTPSILQQSRDPRVSYRSSFRVKKLQILRHLMHSHTEAANPRETKGSLCPHSDLLNDLTVLYLPQTEKYPHWSAAVPTELTHNPFRSAFQDDTLKKIHTRCGSCIFMVYIYIYGLYISHLYESCSGKKHNFIQLYCIKLLQSKHAIGV